MENKVIKFDIDVDKYIELSDKKVEENDLVGSLGFLFTALKEDKNNLNLLSLIADTYADMGLPELSNAYWFKYLDKAPDDKLSVAYEQLAINYFYMDNLWASGYYFHKKSTSDGFISADGLDQDVLDFISEITNRREDYFIAYPFDRANYSSKAKNAKRALAGGDIKTAKYIYSQIPKECLTEDVSGEYALSCLLAKEDDEVKRICKESLEKNGDNVTAYCHLSTVYRVEDNDEKSEYYYKKALKSRKGEKSEAYKITTCAIEMDDHETVSKCIEEILSERPNDVNMNFFYAIALANTYNYQKALERINLCRRINPNNYLYEYYSELFQKIIKGEKKAEKLLPLKYETEIPNAVLKEYKKTVKEITETMGALELILKNEEVKKIVKRGARCSDANLVKDCIFLFSIANNVEFTSFLTDMLLDSDVSEEAKRVIIYSLIVNGRRTKFGMVLGSFYVKIKPKKLLCERKEEESLFISAYAIAMARTAFIDLDDRDKIAFEINRIYAKELDKVISANLLPEYIAVIAVIRCNYKVFKNVKEICSFFGVKYGEIEDYIKGE